MRARFALPALAVVLAGGCRSLPAMETQPPPGAPTKVACTAGPASIEFGALPWLAFACDDGRSVALVATAENAAGPFTFVVRPSEHGVRVQGDGAGDRGATAAAFAELMALDDAALVRLFARALLESRPPGG